MAKHTNQLSGYRMGIKFDENPLAVEQNNYLTKMKIINVYIVPANVGPCLLLTRRSQMSSRATIKQSVILYPVKKSQPDIFETTAGFPAKTCLCTLG